MQPLSIYFKCVRLKFIKFINSFGNFFIPDAPAEISHDPQDAKEIAKKLIASGVC